MLRSHITHLQKRVDVARSAEILKTDQSSLNTQH